MGQTTSSHKETDYVQEDHLKLELHFLFQLRLTQLLGPDELAILSERLLKYDTDGKGFISTGCLERLCLLGLSRDEFAQEDFSSNRSSFYEVFQSIHDSFVVLSQLPFLNDSMSMLGDRNLDLKGVAMAAAIFSGKLSRIWPQSDVFTLLFVSLAVGLTEMIEKNSQPQMSYSVDVLKALSEHEGDNLDPAILSKRIRWRTFESLNNLDDLDVQSLSLAASELLHLVAFFLLFSSLTPKAHHLMRKELVEKIQQWDLYLQSALPVLRAIDPTINDRNLKSKSVYLEQLRCSEGVGLPALMVRTMLSLIKFGLLLLVSETSENERGLQVVENKSKKVTTAKSLFAETRLTKYSTISTIAMALSTQEVGAEISLENLIELYSGSKSGFSIRSLELKIFKWQAATLLLVSGKRIKQKTMETNRRYQTFDLEYPRYFRSNENRHRDWQASNDTITYAVYLNHPWVNSNKSNFGDESTTIISLQPRLDVFTSRKSLVLGGKLVYFNNLGMGLGFGNEQPINKNTSRKYLPGSVSFTIEANLEFAIFRHLPGSSSSASQFFNTSMNATIASQDYEDRFTITDLEVWGVGLMKELEEQKKQWEWEEKQALARQSVNIRNLGEDRAFLEMAGLVGNHAGGGSM